MDGHHSQSGFTCKSCQRPNSVHMIVCDQCRLWEHLDCAGVHELTPNRPYSCKQCRTDQAAGSNISSRLRSHTKRIPSSHVSGGKSASNVGSKVSSVASSSRSSIVKARLELIEEEAKMKQKEFEEEEALKKLEHEEAERQLQEKKKQMEEQKKLMEEESLLRQRKLEADKARLLKQQSIRRESLEKKNEVILQISERGSVVESTTSSRDKVANWLAVNLPQGATDRNALGNPGNSQTDLVPSVPNGVSSLDIDVPSRRKEIPSTLQTTRSAAGQARCPPQPPVLSFPTVSAATGINFPRVSGRYQEVRSSTVREPFQQFVTSSRSLQTNPLVVQPNLPAIRRDPTFDEYDRQQQISHRQLPAWTTSAQYDTVPHLPAAHQSAQPSPIHHDMFTEPVQRFPASASDHSQAPRSMNLQGRVDQPGVLSPQQIAARQVVGKDLPHFGGDPADWPMFISSFEQSTVACGYSNAENLARLQRCLTGHARDAVRSRLLLPANVPQVINTLRTLYGRPELLIRSLHETIRRTPGPRHDRPESILEFGLAVQNFVDHLQAANQEEHLANPMLMQELVEKLPGPMRMDWAAFKTIHPRATVLTFGEFMSKLVNAASEVSFELPGFQKEWNSEKQQRLREKARIQAHSTESAPSPKSTTESTRKPPKICRICKREGHRVAECSEFKHLSMEDRWKEVHDKGLCRTCLNNHGKWPCKSWQGCGFAGCRLKHHTLLHSLSAPDTSTHSVNVSSGNPFQDNGQTLFRVLPVVLYGNGKSLTVFAFIDEGSQITMLEEKVAKELGLSGPRKPLTLQWTGNVKRNELRSEEVSLKISGKCSANRYDLHQARTVSCLLLPAQRFNYQEMATRFPHLKGLPIEDHDVVQPKLLIGLDNLRLGVPLKLREGGPFDPIAAKCRLGWGVYGRTSMEPVARASVNFHTSAASSSDDLLNEQLRDFFTLENSGVGKANEKLESDEEKRARKLLENTTKRTALGFETGLLWKIDEPSFPETYPMAIRRMKALEKKFCCNPSMMQRIYEQLCDFEQKGYVRQVSQSEVATIDHRKTWFLPLGVVINPKKPGKMRLIWDAAAKVAGVSFNSYLLKGPDLLTPLPRVLSGFRLFPVAVSGDIREMFLQIKLQATDRTAQMFVFRRKPDEAVQVYAIEVTMFGSTCSPSSAQFVKNANAEQYAQHYPRAAAAIKEHHYVDDYLDSFRTIDEAVRVVKDVKFVHSRGGFEIRNFLSNENEVLRRTGEIEPDSSKDFALVRTEATESVLGMRWIPADDIFTYTFSVRDDLKPILHKNHIPTKREVLKIIMSLFDPMGFVSFFLVHGKVLMQDVWASGIGWDDEINDRLFLHWRQWVSYFPQLDSLRIPRCYFGSPFPKNFDRLELHVLVDASDSAYACVAYYRLETDEGIQVSLISAKTKVAPLKVLSVPRLELKAAVLGVRLMEAIEGYHTYSISRRVLWSDSTTVLAWIRSEHRRYNKFVAVRIGEILTATDVREWRWVPSALNTADIATKWKNGPDVSSTNPWFSGPSFLLQSESFWPQQTVITTTCEELRPVHTHLTPSPLIDSSRFSRWSRLQRTMGFVLRFIDNIRRKRSGAPLRQNILSQDELKRAEVILWKVAQTEAFPEEIAILMETRGSPDARHQSVAKSSSIYKSWPFLDEHGVLRQRGRIGAATFASTEAKYPAILPRQHQITFLLVDWYHRRFRHANRETVTNEIRQRFEISKLRALVEKVRRGCMMCRVRNALPSPPAMAPLPAARLQPFVRPFTYVGVDYFGPVFVKVGRSQVKRWIALFTCLTIRAVHLEVVHSLSTESCIMAVRRFVARRGYPAEFHSDNGTCFQGASKEIETMEIEKRNNAIATAFTTAKTRWCFIPPATPHMGGAWERLVRSVKVAIGSIADGPRTPDDEVLETILLEAESLINTRPLTYIPLQSADEEALTPNHFLLGSSNGDKLPPTESVLSPAVLRSSWKLAQAMTQRFWTRWVKEYLPVITRRSKWFEEVRDVAVGDLVLVVGGTTKDQWTRGRVEAVTPGRDGRVRQALVRTAAGVHRRPSVKLAVLDVMENGEPLGKPQPEVTEVQGRN